MCLLGEELALELSQTSWTMDKELLVVRVKHRFGSAWNTRPGLGPRILVTGSRTRTYILGEPRMAPFSSVSHGAPMDTRSLRFPPPPCLKEEKYR